MSCGMWQQQVWRENISTDLEVSPHTQDINYARERRRWETVHAQNDITPFHSQTTALGGTPLCQQAYDTAHGTTLTLYYVSLSLSLCPYRHPQTALDCMPPLTFITKKGCEIYVSTRPPSCKISTRASHRS